MFYTCVLFFQRQAAPAIVAYVHDCAAAFSLYLDDSGAGKLASVRL